MDPLNSHRVGIAAWGDLRGKAVQHIEGATGTVCAIAYSDTYGFQLLVEPDHGDAFVEWPATHCKLEAGRGDPEGHQ